MATAVPILRGWDGGGSGHIVSARRVRASTIHPPETGANGIAGPRGGNRRLVVLITVCKSESLGGREMAYGPVVNERRVAHKSTGGIPSQSLGRAVSVGRNALTGRAPDRTKREFLVLCENYPGSASQRKTA